MNARCLPVAMAACLLLTIIIQLFDSGLPSAEAAEIVTGSDPFSRGYHVMGYDDNCSYLYPRPSVQISPSDKEFENVWGNEVSVDSAASRWPFAFSCNVDDDESLEILGLNNDRYFCIDDDGTKIWDRKMPLRSSMHIVADPNGDGLFESFIDVKGTNQSAAQVWIFDHRGEILRKITINFLDVKRFYDTDIQVTALEDLNEDGKLELVLTLHTAYDLYPRGLVILDYSSGEMVGNFRCASHVTNMVFSDVDGDGGKDIVFGATASMNGAVIPSTATNDFNSYVIAIDHQGREKWRNRISHDFLNPIYSYPMVACCDIEGDGNPEIISYLGTKDPGVDTDRGEVTVLNGNNGRAKYSPVKTPYQWIRPAGICDIDNDGNMEAIVQGDMLNDSLDGLAVIDLNDGRLKKKVMVPDTGGLREYIPVGINDLNGDGKIEIVVCVTETGDIHVFDSDLDLLWSYHGGHTGASAVISDIIPGGVNEIAVIGNGVSLLSLDIDLELKRSDPYDEVLYLLPGEEVTFEAKVENTGNIVWLVEYVLVQERGNRTDYIESFWSMTPRPGYDETISFLWKAPMEFPSLNVSLRVNISEFDRGLVSIVKEVKWRVYVFNELLISSLYDVIWYTDDRVETGGSLRVSGKICCMKDLDDEDAFDFKRAWERIECLYLTITFVQGTEDKEIPLKGGDFSFSFKCPETPGSYEVDLNLTEKRTGYHLSDSRMVDVRDKHSLIKEPIFWIAIPIIVSSALTSYAIFRKVTKRRIIPAIPVYPLYSRDLDITEHELRNEILKLIQRKPGMTPKQIMGEMGIRHYNTVKHHVQMLENHEMIQVLKDPARPRLNLCYPMEFRSSEVGYLSEAMKRVLSEIERNPGATRRDLKKDWPYSKGYLTQCIDDLNDRGYIDQDEDGGFRLK